MPMTSSARLVALAAVLLTTAAAGYAAPVPTDTPAPVPTVWSGEKPPFGFTGGAASEAALVDQFLAGMLAGDLDALNRLRVTKEEYGSIIVPGMVEKGKPPRTTFEKVNAVFYGMMDSRSRYALQALVDRFKGKKIVRHEVSFTEPPQEWAWYSAKGDTFIVLFDEAGERYEMKTGWIAEVDGRFKFIGFNWDN